MTCEFHRVIAEELIGLGGVLRCTVCLTEKGLGRGLIAAYLERGWPEHCDRVMRWVTDRELLQEQKGMAKVP